MKNDKPSTPQLAEVQRLYRELQEVRSIQSALPNLPSGRLKETLIDRVNHFLSQGTLISDFESKIEKLERKIVELDSIILNLSKDEITESADMDTRPQASRSTWSWVSWMKVAITIVILYLIWHNNYGAT